MDKNKLIAIVVAVVAIVIFGYFIFSSKKESIPANIGQQSGDITGEQQPVSSTADTTTSTTSTAATSTTKSTTQTKKTTTTKAPGAVTLSYTNALKTYSASGYRFQIINGRASPGTMIVKQGKTFMLDNRDGKSHSVKVGTASYSIGAYGFVIATARTLGTNYIMVDGISSSKIEVEK
ncbi:MAG: hypothetical protein NTW66_03450 [Candidatus Magasanikbacteria bacterium]|nr:hypothetical protein [Candidatus Magasanikbacteria bacterium]